MNCVKLDAPGHFALSCVDFAVPNCAGHVALDCTDRAGHVALDCTDRAALNCAEIETFATGTLAPSYEIFAPESLASEKTA